MKQNMRCALLAGTMMSAIATASSSVAAERLAADSEPGTITLAQAVVNPNDPNQKAKAPPPKGAPPAAAPHRATPPQPPAPPAAPKGVQMQQPQQQPTPGQPGRPLQAQQPAPGQPAPPPGPAQRQFGQPKGAPGALPKGTPPTPVQQPQPAQPPAPAMRQVTPPVPPPGLPKAPQPALNQPQAPGTPGAPVIGKPAPGITPPPGAPVIGRPAPGFTPPPGAPPAALNQPHPPGTPGAPTTAPVIGRPAPALAPPPPAGTAAITPMHGRVDQLRTGRVEHTEANGRVVIQEPGGRVIVREGGRAFIRHDESERFRLLGRDHRIEERGQERFVYVGRPGGVQIINVTGPDGRLLRRMRRGPDGREVVLINNTVVGAAVATGFILALAAPAILIPRERYIVDVSAAPPALLYETLDAPPVVALERAYALDEIRFNVNLRDRVRRLDLDAITFETGSWEITPEQYPKLQVIANAIGQVLARHPEAVFMIEGHTDAVGNDVDNLSLSDRRAESVSVVLTEQFQIPPENMVTQGYGEQFLKIPTDGPSRENRRVAVRNISHLLAGR